jgi:hypothetical protein
VGPQESVSGQVARVSEFRRVKSRNIDIRIRDIAKSEIPMEVKGVEKSTRTCVG